MPPPLNTPVHRLVIVILIALPAHTVNLPNVAVAACTGNLSIFAFAVRGHCACQRLAHRCPCFAWLLQAQQFAYPCTSCARGQLAQRPRCQACQQFARCCPCCAWPSQAWQFARHCPCHVWPLQTRQFARTCARCANYLPDVALATRAIDLPVIALAVHAGNALLSPAADHTLALIASC
jgi:hypothetical protein